MAKSIRQNIEDELAAQEAQGEPAPATPAVKPPGDSGYTNPLPYPDEFHQGIMRGLRRRSMRVGDDPKQYGIGHPAVKLGPGKFVGDVNLRQWKQRLETHLNPDEIAEARRWYKDALPAFQKYFGEDMAPKMAGAWLIANKNVDPAGAQLNALRIAEQLHNLSQQFAQQKKGGLAHDELMQYWQAIRSGNLAGMAKLGGQKIYDFIDSFLGKNTRTYYGDDPRMGAPAVADIHSLRDMGHIDDALWKWIKKVYGDKKAAGIRKTLAGGSPDEPKYEWAADKMRAFTDQLNREGYMGGNWTPSELQAVGWKTMSKMLGRAGQTPEEAIRRHIRHVSTSLMPAPGAPYHEQFPELANLTPEQHVALNQRILPLISNFASDVTGAHMFQRAMGLGGQRVGTPGSNQSPFSNSMTQRLIASPEVAGGFTDIAGHLLQSGRMLSYRPGMGTHWGVSVHGPGFDNPETVRNFWDQFAEAHPDLANGFSPSIHEDGTPGIEMIYHEGGKKLFDRLNNEVRPSIARIGDSLGIDTDSRVFRAETEAREHDWQADPTGSSYMARASAQYGPDLPQRVENFKRQQLDPTIQGFLNEIRGPGAEAGPAAAPPEEPLGAAPPPSQAPPPSTGPPEGPVPSRTTSLAGARRRMMPRPSLAQLMASMGGGTPTEE